MNIDDVVTYVDRGDKPQRGIVFDVYQDGYSVLSDEKQCLDPVRKDGLTRIGTAAELGHETKVDFLTRHEGDYLFIDF